jgi:uncharacterized protein (DUF1501 family)
MTRRRFLTLSGVTAAGALAVGATQVTWTDLLANALRDPLPPQAGVLVLVTLYGGNDGLNTVVPAGDPPIRTPGTNWPTSRRKCSTSARASGSTPG